MRAVFRRPATLIIGLLAPLLGMLATYGAAGQPNGTAASWLDEATIASWNTANQTIPAAPQVQEPVNPRCRDLARPPQTEEDKQVRDRGWDLVGPFHGGWQVLVVRGTASYDGMCRPMQYQDFVFVRGAFAGTLAPKPMDSRTDGALGRVTLQRQTQLTAEYPRYEKSDPLCCPSRITSVSFEVTGDPPVVRATSASTTPTGGDTGRP